MRTFLFSSIITSMGCSTALADSAVNCTFVLEEDEQAELVILGEGGLLKMQGKNSDKPTTYVLLCNNTPHTHTCIYFWTHPLNEAIIHNIYAVTKDLKNVVVSRSGPNAPDLAFVSIYPAQCSFS